MINRDDLLLYAVTDRSWLKENQPLCDAVYSALEGGVTLVQLREKNLDTEAFIKSAVEIKRVCDKFNVPLIINDNIDVCIASNADGVHLGQGDTSVKKAREILGDTKIIGITAKTPGQAIEAEQGGADYVGSGAVFGTFTKNDAKKMELGTLKTIAEAVNIPVVAIGGINEKNICLLKNKGISGAAVVSGIFAQNGIKSAASNLKDKIKDIVKE